MAMTPYGGNTDVIAALGTTPQERGLETQQFKAKFDEALKAFVTWFNATHKTEFDAHMADDANVNLLINGDFQVWQRGTSFNTELGYTADRWKIASTDGSYPLTVVKDVSGIKITPSGAPGFLQYFLEDSDFNRLNGKIVTLQISTNGVVTTSTFTATTNHVVNIGIVGVTPTIINWVKLEFGSHATPFVPRPFAEELAMCQRYFEKSYNYTDAPGTPSPVGDGAVVQTVPAYGNVYIPFRFKVVKRVKPTTTLYDDLGAAGKINVGGTNGTDFFGVSSTDSGGGLTTNNIPAITHIQFFWVADAEIY